MFCALVLQCCQKCHCSLVSPSDVPLVTVGCQASNESATTAAKRAKQSKKTLSGTVVEVRNRPFVADRVPMRRKWQAVTFKEPERERKNERVEQTALAADGIHARVRVCGDEGARVP